MNRYTGKEMIKLYSPENEVQLAMLKGIFESEGIPIFVHNDNFGSMKTGIQIELFNKKTIMVHEQHLEEAAEIIKTFIGNVEQAQSMDELETPNYSFLDKCRMVIEVFLFGWLMPGKKNAEKQRQKQNRITIISTGRNKVLS